MDTLLPEEYRLLELPELEQRIQRRKEEYKGEMLILGHHYQRDEIIRFSDYTGDSYMLSETAAKNKDIRYTVFCGVSFMAESARILAGETNTVVQPDTSAGCPLADMADIEDVEKAWKIILSAVSGAAVVPITYINSSSALKAFCGENNGVVCTSSNADKAINMGFSEGEKVFFFPDYNLGINTANKIGIAGDRIIKWDPTQRFGGHSNEDIKKAKPDVSKNSAGYFLWNVWDRDKEIFDIPKLIVGSQGTFGIITEITLGLIRPKKHSTLLVIFLDDFKALGDVISRVLKHNPESFESYDDHTLKIALLFLPDII